MPATRTTLDVACPCFIKPSLSLVRVSWHSCALACVYIRRSWFIYFVCALLRCFVFSYSQDYLSQPNAANLRRDQGAAAGTPDEQAPAGLHGFPRPREAEDGGDVWQERERRRAGWAAFLFSCFGLLVHILGVCAGGANRAMLTFSVKLTYWYCYVAVLVLVRSGFGNGSSNGRSNRTVMYR